MGQLMPSTNVVNLAGTAYSKRVTALSKDGPQERNLGLISTFKTEIYLKTSSFRNIGDGSSI